MDNSLFIKNILILIFCVILIHIFLNDFLNNKNYIYNNEDFTDDSFKKNNKTIVYLFYADWCGHCKHYKPIFNKFKNTIKNNSNIQIIEINADDDIPGKEELYNKYNIDGFPTTVIHKNNSFKKLVGDQTIGKLIEEVQNVEKFGNIEFNTDSPDLFNKKIDLFNNNKDILIYNFNTTWCNHSQQFQPIWNRFSDAVKIYENVKAIDVKCDLDENINFCSQFNIKSVPSILIVKNNELIPYEGSRTVEGLLNVLKINIDENDLENQVKDNDETITGNNFMLLNNNENNTNITLESNIKTTVYNFNTTWCKYSRDFQAEWNTFVNSLKHSDGVSALDVKCDNDQNKELCKKYNIPGYPSVVIETENKIEIYDGPRSANAIRKHLNL